MSLKALLQDPEVCPSVALLALKKLLGPTVESWEPETIRIELSRREIEVTDGLMAKLLGAITVDITTEWSTDHDVLFAFALACSGVPAASDALHIPTPEQLCWAIREITGITSARISDFEGFDPDTIDPAIAAILHEEGYFVAPQELEFVQDVLDDMNQYAQADELVASVKAEWASYEDITTDTIRRKLEQLPEDDKGVQLRRLGSCRLYVAEHEQKRAQQHVLLNE